MTRTAETNNDYQLTAKELITQFVEFSAECDTTAQLKEEALNSLIEHLGNLSKEIKTPDTSKNDYTENEINAINTPIGGNTRKYILALGKISDVTDMIADATYSHFSEPSSCKLLEKFFESVDEIRDVIMNIMSKCICDNLNECHCKEI